MQPSLANKLLMTMFLLERSVSGKKRARSSLHAHIIIIIIIVIMHISFLSQETFSFSNNDLFGGDGSVIRVHAAM